MATSEGRIINRYSSVIDLKQACERPVDRDRLMGLPCSGADVYNFLLPGEALRTLRTTVRILGIWSFMVDIENEMPLPFAFISLYICFYTTLP